MKKVIILQLPIDSIQLVADRSFFSCGCFGGNKPTVD